MLEPGRAHGTGMAVLVLVATSACAVSSREVQRGPRVPFGALLLNGGGWIRSNKLSHVRHLDEFLRTLKASGVPEDQIGVLNGDGDDPAVDVMMTVDARGEHAGLLEGTTMEGLLRPQRASSSKLAHPKVGSATREDLVGWFEDEGPKLRAGDTLLVFVTDHGERGKQPTDNRIVLWNRESIAVHDFGAAMNPVDPNVRIVTVMSQCYSGGFAELAFSARPAGRAPGSVCGFFSTSADRIAEGCYADSRVSRDDGHAFRFVRALHRTGSFAEAHRLTLIEDGTIDVPLRTSDVYLRSTVEAEAKRVGRTVDEVIASRLPDAWSSGVPEASMARDVAKAFSLELPNDADALESQRRVLDKFSAEVRAHAQTWREAVEDLAQVHLDEFLARDIRLKERLTPRVIERLDPATLRGVQQQFIAGFGQFSAGHQSRVGAIELGRGRAQVSSAIADRAQVRQAALLRLRTLLVSIVGRGLLEGARDERKAVLAGIDACEDARLPSKPAANERSAPPPPLPTLAFDRTMSQRFRPGVTGVRLVDAPGGNTGPPAGAMVVAALDAGGLASKSGIQLGDLIVGVEGAPISEPGSAKLSLAMARPTSPSQPLRVDVVRAGKRLTLALPSGEGGPRRTAGAAIGAAAWRAFQSLEVVRGDVPATLRHRQPFVLFFWATWCKYCKDALPDLLTFEESSGIPVIAVSPEVGADVRDWLAQWSKPFPVRVASDPEHHLTSALKIEGFPTLVRVDGAGAMVRRVVGFDPKAGLRLAEEDGGD